MGQQCYDIHIYIFSFLLFLWQMCFIWAQVLLSVLFILNNNLDKIVRMLSSLVGFYGIWSEVSNCRSVVHLAVHFFFFCPGLSQRRMDRNVWPDNLLLPVLPLTSDPNSAACWQAYFAKKGPFKFHCWFTTFCLASSYYRCLVTI